MRIVRFNLEPWQKGGSIVSSGRSSSSSLSLSSLPDSVLRRQRCSSLDNLANIDGNYFERRTTNTNTTHSSNSRYSSYSNSKRKMPQTVKRLTILCSDILARYVCANMKYSQFLNFVCFKMEDFKILFWNFSFLLVNYESFNPCANKVTD